MTYSDSQLRGALLEEVLLFLLRSSGYQPVLAPGNDPTLQQGRSGLEVRGRGVYHQIDAIADFAVSPPFTNPQRLLLEAKFYRKPIGVEVIRNAVGVLKDVCEGWIVDARLGSIPGKRYHYLYSLFSASDFSVPAQDYAFAHDIFLLPLRTSTFFQPVVRALERISVERIRDRPTIGEVRQLLRSQLLGTHTIGASLPRQMGAQLDDLVRIAEEQSFGFVTMFGNQFPAFLVAAPGVRAEDFDAITDVRIRKAGASWFIETRDGVRLLSFDLPEAIFIRYEQNGRLSRSAVADIKGDLMTSFFAFHNRQNDLRLLQFRLDEEWFQSIRLQVN